MPRLTEIPTTTTMTDDDLFYIVDVEDTTDNPAGSSKSIKKSDVMGNVQRVEIARLTSGAANTWDIAGIPTDYDRLILEGAVGNDSGSNCSFELFQNGDYTSANYFHQFLYATGTTTTTAEGSTALIGFGGGALALYNPFRLVIEGPALTGIKTVLCDNSYYVDAVQLRVYKFAMLHKTDTAPITSLRLDASAGNITGNLVLYGEKTV